MPMTKQTAEQIASKWADRIAGSGEAFRAGVAGVDVAPGVAAAEQKDKYIRNVNAAADKWARRVRGVSLQSWKDAMMKKTAPILATRAAEAKGKFASFMRSFMAYQQGVQQELKSTPRGTLDQNIQRAVLQIRANARYGADQRELPPG